LAAKTVPVNTRIPLEACQSAIRRERVQDALISCDKLTRESPKSADAVVLLAHANLLAGHDGETLRLARRASAIDPKCAEAYLLIGNVQQAAGRMPDARTAYEAYLHAAPRGAHAAEVRAILKTL
jgi:predicted Zn-dependent protease